MNRDEIKNMEKHWEKYHRSIPDFPIKQGRDWFETITLAVAVTSWLAIILTIVLLVLGVKVI